MKNIYLILSLTLITITTIAQEKYSFGFSFGLAKNFYKNSYETDNNHFNFKKPTSIYIGSQIIKHIDIKNKIVAKFGFTNKKIALEYKLNEPKIPYNLNESTIERFNSLSLSFGYRRDFKIKRIRNFVEIDLLTDYNINSSIGSSGTSNGISNSSVELSEPLLYQSLSTSNIGQESITIGNNFSFGIYFNEKKRSELSINIYLPYNNIQSKTSSYTYQWRYLNEIYYHNLKYKGTVIYPNLKFTYYVFHK